MFYLMLTRYLGHFLYMNITESENRKNTKIKICSVCHKEFTAPKHSNSKISFCSYNCKMIHKYNLPQTGIRICQECGKEYYYIQGQGNWDKNNNKIWSKGEKNGQNKTFTLPSHKFCCYECGVKHKEKLRGKTNISKYGRISPWQDPILHEKLFNQMKERGTLFTSKPEKEIRNFIEQLNIATDKLIFGNSITTPRLEIDIYIPSLNIGIEFNGNYFHAQNGKKEKTITPIYHYNKRIQAKQKNIHLLQIWENDWTNNKPIIESILRNKLNKPIYTINASDCSITQLTQEQYIPFHNTNNLYQCIPSHIHLALIYNNQIQQTLTFYQIPNTNSYILTHNTPILNTHILNGTTTLLNHFIQQYNPSSISTTIQNDLFTGNVYLNNNFSIQKIIQSNAFYVKSRPIQKINPTSYSKNDLNILLQKKKILLCYDSGSTILTWNK